MELNHPERLEPHILLGIANERLRHDCKNLQHLTCGAKPLSSEHLFYLSNCEGGCYVFI